MAKNGRFWNYQTTEKLLQGAEKTIITRPWTSFPQSGAAPVSPKNIWTNPKPHDTWKSLFQARILVQNVIFALKMDYLIAPKFHQFYPIVDPRSTGSQDHNFDQICLILQEVHSTISLSKVWHSKSANDPYLLHIMYKFLFINPVGSAIYDYMLNKLYTDVMYMKWRHDYDVIIVTSSCDVTCHKHGRFLHQHFDFDSMFLSSE